VPISIVFLEVYLQPYRANDHHSSWLTLFPLDELQMLRWGPSASLKVALLNSSLHLNITDLDCLSTRNEIRL